MEPSELLEILSRGEDGQHQFKLDFTNPTGLASEIAAFANSEGGKLIIGVTDLGQVAGLTSERVRNLNQLISTSASEQIKPAVMVRTENVTYDGRVVIVVHVPKGLARPYLEATTGAIWVKSGADKRKVTAREELQRIFQSASLLHADEVPADGTGFSDVDIEVFRDFYRERFESEMEDSGLELPVLLRNMNLMDETGRMNIAGLLLFGKSPSTRLPAFNAKAVAFPGTELADTEYLDSRDLNGTIPAIFTKAISFLSTHLVRQQGEQGFNSIGDLEIPKVVLEELVANALIHRDYFVSAPIRILLFQDRIEIVSPGHLPNNLTIANIKSGNSNIRNPILASFATYMLPYRGLGSGIVRALRAWPEIDLVDDREGNLFKAIVRRRAFA